MHNTAFNHIEHTSRSHKFKFVAGVNLTFFYSYIYNYALVAVVVAVKNQCTKRCSAVAARSRNIGYNFFKHVVNVDACLSRNSRCILGRNTYNILNFCNNPVGVCTRQINLVYNGDNLKSAVNRKISIRKRLSFNALRCINN